MAETKIRTRADLDLAKLGIREIHERIEVSPIITDPGTVGLDVEDGTPKSYLCTINFTDRPIKPIALP